MGEQPAERKSFPELASEFDARERRKTAAALRGHATRKRKRAERTALIHLAECRRVIEAAKEWFRSPEKDGATADELALAVAILQEAERA